MTRKTVPKTTARTAAKAPAETAASKGGRKTAKRTPGKSARSPAGKFSAIASSVMEEARSAGLLDGEATEHISFRAPKALVDAAKRESGMTRSTELCLFALVMLAHCDPVAEYMQKTYGALGKGHRLDY